AGTKIDAYIGNTRCGTASVRSTPDFTGYILDVVGPDSIPGCTRNASITLRINDRPTVQPAITNTPPGRREALDIAPRSPDSGVGHYCVRHFLEALDVHRARCREGSCRRPRGVPRPARQGDARSTRPVRRLRTIRTLRRSLRLATRVPLRRVARSRRRA